MLRLFVGMTCCTSVVVPTEMIFPDPQSFWWTSQEWCIGRTSRKTYGCGPERTKCLMHQDSFNSSVDHCCFDGTSKPYLLTVSAGLDAWLQESAPLAAFGAHFLTVYGDSLLLLLPAPQVKRRMRCFAPWSFCRIMPRAVTRPTQCMSRPRIELESALSKGVFSST